MPLPTVEKVSNCFVCSKWVKRCWDVRFYCCCIDFNSADGPAAFLVLGEIIYTPCPKISDTLFDHT